MERRKDTITAALINGILTQRGWRGRSYAARALYDLGIPLDQAIRILTIPERTRGKKEDLTLALDSVVRRK